MTFRVLWPIMRWPDDWRIESEAVGEGVRAEFVDRFENVTDDQWRNCDGIVAGVDVPAQYRAKLEKCRIFVKPAVGFDNIDLKAWGELGIPVCNVPDYGTMEVADHAIALMLTLMKGIEFHTVELRANPKRQLAARTESVRPTACRPARSVWWASVASAPPRRCAPRRSAWTWCSTIRTSATASIWRWAYAACIRSKI